MAFLKKHFQESVPSEGVDIQGWGINGRMSPRIFYKLMSMYPAVSDYTGSSGYNETRVRLAIGNSQGKDTRGEEQAGRKNAFGHAWISSHIVK